MDFATAFLRLVRYSRVSRTLAIQMGDRLNTAHTCQEGLKRIPK
jgi:hypothetical protein